MSSNHSDRPSDKSLEKFFEVPSIPEENHEEPFKDFLQEVDSMLINLTSEGLGGDELNNLPDPQQTPELLDEHMHFRSLPRPDISGDPTGDQSAEEMAGYADMQITFMAIMQQVLRPVTRYVKAIMHGEESRELFEVMNFTVTPLVDKVEQVQLFKQTADLLLFRSTLTRILATHFGTLSTELRDQLIATFMEVKKGFGLDLRGNQRAVVNVLSFYRMLCFSNQVDVEQIRKFFAIGIPSLTWVRRTPAAEIASLSGMDLKQAQLLRKMALAFREIEELEEGQLGPMGPLAHA